MRSYEELLSGRAEEITSHLSLIEELTDAAIAREGVANLQRVEMEHVDVLKSGFLVHLYNVVEAVMAQILEEVRGDVVRYPPAKWSSLVRTEWVRARAGVEWGIESHRGSPGPRRSWTKPLRERSTSSSASGTGETGPTARLRRFPSGWAVLCRSHPTWFEEHAMRDSKTTSRR